MDKEKAREIIDVLSENFSSKPALRYKTPFELLIAVILSAQCTDERVNKVTEKLFSVASTPSEFLELSVSELEKYIFSCGLYKTKAKHILSLCRELEEKYSGQVPKEIEDLRKLSGVGRKTANVVASVAFDKDAIAVDTHVFRVSKRIGFSDGKNVLKTEYDLMETIEKSSWKRAHHYLIYLGRKYCKAGKPDCLNCPIEKLCEKNK